MGKTIIDIITEAKPKTSTGRREIIQIKGTHFLIGAILFVNAVVAAGVYRYHNVQLFREEKAQNDRIGAIVHTERLAKIEVMKLEKVNTWKETAYAKARPWTGEDGE